MGLIKDVKPNTYVTVGWWPGPPFSTDPKHEKGVVYNMEAAKREKGFSSLKLFLDKSNLATVNSFIINNDDYTLVQNCSYYARRAWNLIAPTNYRLGGDDPVILSGSIRGKSGMTFNVIIQQSYPIYHTKNKTLYRR